MVSVISCTKGYGYSSPASFVHTHKKSYRVRVGVRVRAIAEAEAEPAKVAVGKRDGNGEGSIRVVLGAGGTGGHVYPAIAIADELKGIHPNVEIHFVGSTTRLEWKAVPAAGYPILPIPTVALQRPLLNPSNLLLPLKLMHSLWECWKILGELQPQLVVGTGGYVAAPICLAAAMRGIRLAIQEQNVSPGRANKVLAVFATVIFVAFPASVELFPQGKGKCVVSGNPIRSALRKYVSTAVARSQFFPRSGGGRAEVVLILGGSLGANSINITVLEMYSQMLTQHPNRFIIWQTGTASFDEMDSLVRPHPRLVITPFLNNMDLAYAAADLVVARAGAMTCSELLTTGKPSILIPSTFVAEDHQMKNATFMSEAGCAKLLYEDELDSTALANSINEILGDETLMMDMRERALKAALPDAATKIADSLLSLVQSGIKRN